MIDQATELRKLVLRSMRERAAAAGPPPRLLILAGGEPGVGVTTLTVNLGIALADQGLRVVVVDADVNRADVARLCGLPLPRTGRRCADCADRHPRGAAARAGRYPDRSRIVGPR